MEKKFKDTRYDAVKNEIYKYMDMYDEDKVKNLSFVANGMEGELALSILKNIDNDNNIPSDLTVEEWKYLCDHIAHERATDIEDSSVSLVSGVTNDLEIQKHDGSQWQLYKKKLKEKGFSTRSIIKIQESAYQILKQLDTETLDEKDPKKGLVVGNVQSGKTANMIALMSMAADSGFNFFIVFSGVIENLRVQTEKRMFEDLKLGGNLNFEILSKPSVTNQDPAVDWKNIKLHNTSKNRYFTVCLKNKSRMEDLYSWLYSDKNKAKQLKVLIIDDEADQASINTNKLDADKERTSINNTMLKLVEGKSGHKPKVMNYISYTATPYANVLNETEGLFPKDFVFTLPLSEDYIGPREIFGLQEPEHSPPLDIVRQINSHDFEEINSIHEGVGSVPQSLKDSITWFFLSAAIARIFKINKPVTMLIHTSHNIAHHEEMYEAIKQYLIEIKLDKEKFIDEQASKIYNNETLDFQLSDFKAAMDEYSELEKVKDYPEFDEVKKRLLRVLELDMDDYINSIRLDGEGSPTFTRGFHVAIDNSQSQRIDPDQHVRLIYPKNDNDLKYVPMFIVIGGNTLSRGLTLEGLTTSYFARTSKQADSLYQMGRWFGYRKGYELLPRIWMDNETRSRFEHISQINEELAETIKEMVVRGQKPEDLGVKVKNSPDNNFLRITSKNKMQQAEETQWDFSNINKQTIIFTDNEEILTNNLDVTRNFLVDLDKTKMEKKKNLFVWHQVSYRKVKEFLSNFKFEDRENFFRNMKMFIEWYDKNELGDGNTYQDWNIILATKEPKSKEESKYSIHGYNFSAVTRTRKYTIEENPHTKVSIGALRTTKHLLADLNDYNELESRTPSNREVKEKRKKAGLGMTPQIIIYFVDKDSKPKQNSSKRDALNFSEDVVGINLYIPGNNTKTNLATYLSTKPKGDPDEANDEYNEE